MQQEYPVFVAGGLNLDNVSDAVHAIRPSGVDVASGVETRNMKDGEKMAAFVRFAKLDPQLFEKAAGAGDSEKIGTSC